MAVRDVYTKDEEAMLAKWRQHLDNQVGWMGETATELVQYPVYHRVATKETITTMAHVVDYWNPLYQDEVYARNTRWGGIIAPPVFITAIGFGPQDYGIQLLRQALGNMRAKVCHSYEFFKPIYPGDSFRVWRGYAHLVDITRAEENANRRFKFDWELSYINQKDEIVGIFRRADVIEQLPTENPAFRKGLKPTTDFIYTDADIAAIDAVGDAEEIRGADIRWWEDVNVGDEPKPVVIGPIAPWDAIAGLIGSGLAPTPMRQVRKEATDRYMVDPVTNVPRKGIEFHVVPLSGSDQFSYSTSQAPILIEGTMARLVTNWAGDDAFIRRLEWLKLVNIPIGDTMFGKAKVVKKYVSEDGDYLVDLNVWLESVRGYVGYVSPVTVSLLSKEACFKQNRPPTSLIPPSRGRFAPDLSAQGGKCTGTIKEGDRVRIKDRPDWWLPTGYKLAGLEGVVAEVIDETAGQLAGYVLVQMDKEATGIDTVIPMGFCMDAVEKI